VLVLCIGDLHIPYRTHDIPAAFRRLLTPGKITQVLSTGNICDRETYEWLAGIVGGMGGVKGVRGGWDENPALPPSLVVSHPPLRIGVIQGHQAVPLGDTDALSSIARKLDVDVLFSGGTHRFEAFEYEGRFFINPGSATGAYCGIWNSAPAPSAPKEEPPADEEKKGPVENGETKADSAAAPTPASVPAPATQSSLEPASPIPSFALLDIQGAVIVTYVYQLVDGEVKVEKIEYRKNMGVGIPGGEGTA